MEETFLEIEILENGDILFKRELNNDSNIAMIELLSGLGVSNIEDVKNFIINGSNIENILGDEILCG